MEELRYILIGTAFLAFFACIAIIRETIEDYFRNNPNVYMKWCEGVVSVTMCVAIPLILYTVGRVLVFIWENL
jgi:hypothetical protein